MEALILDVNYEHIAPVDIFKSFIWTDRYNKCGDFEIYIPIDEKAVKNLKIDNYIWNKDSKHLMIIETLHVQSDVEEGNMLYVVGRSLESILDRRIIWNETKIDGNLQTGIQQLIKENITNPVDKSRRINNFVFKVSTDPRVTALQLSAEYMGDNLYDVICDICETNDLGFRITLNDNNEFVFELYFGIDRSYDQEINPHVIFSPTFDNIITSEYLESKNNYKNVALIVGENKELDDGTKIPRTATIGTATGLSRREYYTDARDISAMIENDDPEAEQEEMSDEEYNKLLVQRGKEELKDYKYVKAFEGEMETFQLFRYGEDFYLGDIVQVADEYGHEGKERITEIVMTQDSSGYNAYPTFEALDLEEE